MTTPREPIAVVGVSALYPGSTDAAGFWRDILRGEDRISDVPPHRWLIEDYYDPDPKTPDKTYGRRGGFLQPVDFDAMGFGMPPNLAPVTDSSQLLALIVAQRVLTDACGGDFSDVDRSRASCILGVTSAQELLGHMVSRLQRPVWVKALRESGLPEDEVQAACDRIASHYQPWQEATFPGLLGNVVAGRVANRLDLGGTNCVTDAACASALSALSMAVNELWLGDSDLVITGGVDTMTDPLMYMCFSKTPALSPSGDVRPFSDAADGTLLGEGVGMVALKRLSDAEAAGDSIYAVLRGVGSSSDGRAKSVYAPRAGGQALALQRAYAHAGYGPETVELVEAHGTGTKAGDAAEFAGLCEVFAPAAPDRRQWCVLGTVKAQIGHAKAAAGAAGLFKCVMALHQRVLPPTIKVDRPNPKLGIDDSPFYLANEARPWVRDASHPRRASVSSFGFGGTNFHATLEAVEPSRSAGKFCAWPAHLLIFGADSAADVVNAVRAAIGRIDAVGLERTAWELHRSVATGPARLALVAADEDAARAALERAASRIESDPTPFATPDGTRFDIGADPGEVAFLFSGQGSQHVGMGGSVAVHFGAALDVHDAAADVEIVGEPLHRVQFPPTAWDDEARAATSARLTATENAQPCIGITSAATLAVLRSVGVDADHVAGHSFGEITAAYAAGVFDLDGFVRAARERGERMANASDVPGGMLAIVAARADVEAHLERWGDPVVVANHNHPTQVVVSGPLAAIEAVESRCNDEGLRCTRLPVSTAFHSPLVADASGPFGEALAAIPMQPPRCAVWSNATAERHPADADAIRAALAAQIARPVHFVDQIVAMHEAGVRTFVEVGPGSIQTRLVGRILGDRDHVAIATDARGRDGAVSLMAALGALHVAGVRIEPAALWQGLREPVDVSAQPRPRLVIPVDGGNVDAPYPPKGGAAALPPPNPPRAQAPAATPTPNAPAAVPAPAVTTAPVSTAPPRVAPPAPASRPAPARPSAQPRPSTPPAQGGAAPPRSPMRDDDRPSGPLPPDAARAWVDAWADAQRQAAYAHAAWQQAMTEAHTAYLRASEASFAALHTMMGAAPPAVAPPHPRPAAPAPPAPPAPWAAPAPAPAPSYAPPTPPQPAAWPAPQVAPPAPVAAAPAAPARPAPVATPPAAVAPTPAPAAAASAAPGIASLSETLLEVVADKTGYPVDMLQLEMSLEGDLGIDSIKRVEILSALTERVPSLPDVDASEMGALQTLGEIVTALQTASGVPTNGAAAAPVAAPPAPAAAPVAAPAAASTPSAAGSVDLAGALLDVVADKTGYPVDMLQLEMSLEGDLGIDSIKRVEILSALTERVPSLPDVDASEMGALQTLGEIVSRLDEASGGEPGGNPVNPEYGRFDVVEAPVPAAEMTFGPWAPGARVAIAPLEDGAAELGRAFATAVERAGLVVVTGLDDADLVVAIAPPGPDLATCRRGWARLFALARDVAASDVSALAVTWTADPEVPGPNAGIAGFCRTAAAEWPECDVRGVALPADRSPTALADALVRELGSGAANTVVRLGASGARAVETHVPAAAPTGVLVVQPGDVVVVSGGARGVTAACVTALAAAVPAHFVLLGRSDADTPDPDPSAQDAAAMMPSLLAAARERGERPSPADLRAVARRALSAREIRATLAAIEATDATAEYVPVDVTDADAVGAALDRVRASHGPVRAVIHAAGVLADKRLAEKTDDMVERVVRTKVDGLATLLEAVADDPLRALVVFSSVAARTGNTGQADYALANAAITAMARAEAERRGELLVRAIAWGPWDGGMVDPSLRDHFAAAGVPLIGLDAGARAFVDELRAGGAAEVVIGATPRSGGIAADPTAARSVRWRLDGDRHAWLFDHVVHGAPVLPVAASIDLLARAVRTLWPGEVLGGLTAVSVRRPVRLTALNGGGEVLTATASRDGATVDLTLEHRGVVTFTATGHIGRSEIALAVDPGATSPRAEETYGGALFHGPAFQVIHAPMQVGPDGASAALDGLDAARWDRTGFAVDVPALDALLQLAVRWAEGPLGVATLPMGIDRVTLAADLPEGTLLGRVRGAARGRSAARVDARLDAADGTALVALEGISLIARPDAARTAAAGAAK